MFQIIADILSYNMRPLFFHVSISQCNVYNIFFKKFVLNANVKLSYTFVVLQPIKENFVDHGVYIV